MKNLPKSLIGFYMRYAVRPFALMLSAWLVLYLIVRIADGVFWPTAQRWVVAMFENPAPVGAGFLSFALPTVGLIIGIWLVIDVMSVTRAWLRGHWSPRVRNEISQVLLDYVHGQSMSFYTGRIPGKINSQSNYIMGGFDMLEDFAGIFAAVVVITLNMGMVMNVNAWVALVLGIAFAFRLLYSIWRMRPMNRASKTASESSSSLSGKVIDSISNFSIVKLFAGAKSERKYLQPIRDRTIQDRIKVNLMQRLFWVIPMFVWDLLFGVTLLLCAKLFLAGEMKVSEIVFTMSVYMTVMNAISNITDRIPNLVDVIGSAQQSYRELIKPIEITDAPDAAELKVSRGGIQIKNLTFKYGRKKVLDDLSLSIKPGEKVGLVGPSGAGKTTLVNLLMRFYDPSRGAIYIDGHDIKAVTQHSLRSNITFIPQEPALFNRSLSDNISYGKPGADLKQIRAAAKRAAADEFIMATDKKYDSTVGDRGIKLSGGQKQRVAIARAFLKNAPILILDEATSALDSETEAVIQQSFEELSQGRTTIAIAHRLSTLRNMDRIVVIDRGRIIESGPHAALIRKKGGAYARLWRMQSGGFLPEEK
ncbi:MAG: ABC transporter ATP-binding protein/permease [Rickettsiales bacterium]|jgi:ATP-binding cassette subfamily B protein|nr:ABC transporter ATP-binding protein/permease [Rickettsiales bacterium]